jgi:hypothetical protein
MNKVIFGLGLVLVAGVAAAECDQATVLLGSKHFNNVAEYNEVNPGLLIECNGYGFGGYLNSQNRESVIGYKVWKRSYGSADVGVTAGLVTGYNMAPILPSASVFATKWFGEVGVTMMVVPAVEEADSGVRSITVVGVGVNFRF